MIICLCVYLIVLISIIFSSKFLTVLIIIFVSLRFSSCKKSISHTSQYIHGIFFFCKYDIIHGFSSITNIFSCLFFNTSYKLLPNLQYQNKTTL